MKHWKLALCAVAFTATSALPTMADTIKVAMNAVEDLEKNPEYAFVVAFRDALEGTGFDVEVHPSNSLGSEKERLGQTTQGLIHVNLASATTAASISPLLRGMIMPFMFESAEEVDAVMGGTDLLDKINAPLTEAGARIIGFNRLGIDAGIFNTKQPVATLEDLAQLRMRALNKGQVAFYGALGVNATVVAWGEVASALQTSVVDGYVNPPISALRTGHTEFLKHFTPAALAPSVRVIMVSEDWWADLSDDDRAAIQAAVEAGIAANNAWVADWATKVDAEFAAQGVTVTELADGERQKMLDKAAPVHKAVLGEDGVAAFAAALAQVRK